MSRCEHCGDDHYCNEACRPLDPLSAYRDLLGRAVILTEEDAKTIRLLRRHIPPWYGADSDGRGTLENAGKALLDRLAAKVPR